MHKKQTEQPTNALEVQDQSKKAEDQDAIQAKQVPVQRHQGYQAHKAKQSPVQRKPTKKSEEIAHTMGQQYGIDTSKLEFNHNSSFPAKMGAEATIQGNKIDFAPGKDSEANIKHEVGHAIDNAKHGTPKGDKVVNGQKVDTTREAAADKMMNTPLQRKEMGQTTEAVEGNQVVQRVQIGKKKLNTIQKIEKELKKKVQAWAKLNGLDWARVEAHLRRYATDNTTYPDDEAFFHALEYDVRNKSINDEAHTLQEAWTTSQGWKARAKGESSTDLTQGEVKLYRTMDEEEYEAINNGNDKALAGHLGDFKEALNYLYGKSGKPKLLVEFSVPAQNMHSLYRNAAFPDKKSSSLTTVENALKKENKGFKAKTGASANEGYAKGDIGLKSEKHGDAGFSLGIGKSDKPSQQFLSLVSRNKVLAASDGKKVTWEDNARSEVEGGAHSRGYDVVHTSGEGLNCLLWAITQGAPNINPDSGYIEALRAQLEADGLAQANDLIDIYGGAGQALADTLGVRVQVIEVTDDGETLHPILGTAGSVVTILHNGNHFSTLQPRGQ